MAIVTLEDLSSCGPADHFPMLANWGAAIVGIGILIATSGATLFVRAPFAEPGMAIMLFYALISATAIFAFLLTEASYENRQRSGVNYPIVAFLLTFAAPAIGGVWGLALIFTMIIGMSIYRMHQTQLDRRRSARTSDNRRRSDVWLFWLSSLAVFISAVAVGSWAFLAGNSMNYASVFSPEKAVLGLLRLDTLYHSSLASMISELGVSSTGLDGVPLIKYHFLSHAWLGKVANFVGETTVSGYFLGHQIVFLPLLFFTLLVTSRVFMAGPISAIRDMLTASIFLALFMIFAVLDWNSYLVSESHTLGLILFLSGCGFLKTLSQDATRRIGLGGLVFGVTVGLLISAAKLSTGFAFFAGFSYLLLRSRKLGVWQWIALGGLYIFVLVFVVALLMPGSHVGETHYSPFDFLNYPIVGPLNLAVIGAAALLCAFYRVKRQECVFFETTFVMMAVCIVPALLFKIDGGSAYYFLNTATWIAFAVLAAALSHFSVYRFAVPVLTICAIATVAASFINIKSNNTLEAMRADAMQIYDALKIIEGASVNASMPKAPSITQLSVADVPLARLAASIAPFRDTSDPPIVYLGQSAKILNVYPCMAAPFFVPAYIGLPQLWGLPASSCDVGPHYSFVEYRHDSTQVEDPSKMELCDAARKRGFGRILLVHNQIDIELIEC